jgi:hypothetical protein
MIIRVSRVGLVTVALVFGFFHAVLGFASLSEYVNSTGPQVAIGLYLVALFSATLMHQGIKMPWWHGYLTASAAIALPLLVNPALNNSTSHSYATWYVGASGVLLCITTVRQQSAAAWLGVSGVILSMFTHYHGFDFVGASGVLGGLISVVVAGQAVSVGVERGAREATRLSDLASADLAAAAVTTARRAERQMRAQMALENSLPLLNTIIDSKGVLSDSARKEAVMAEVALRDEIRGRDLMTERVRQAALAARLRGVEVLLIDEAGLDSAEPELLNRILDDVANAIDGVAFGKVTVRTVKGESWLVTVGATENPNEPPTLWLRLP